MGQVHHRRDECVYFSRYHKTEAWGVSSAERRKVNVLDMKCLRSLVGVSRMD